MKFSLLIVPVVAVFVALRGFIETKARFCLDGPGNLARSLPGVKNFFRAVLDRPFGHQ